MEELEVQERVINKNGMYDIKSILGKELYEQISTMVCSSGDIKSFKEFPVEKVIQIEDVFLKYKDTSSSVLGLYNFLSLYSLYCPDYQGYFSHLSKIKNNVITDFTKTFTYSDLDPVS